MGRALPRNSCVHHVGARGQHIPSPEGRGEHKVNSGGRDPSPALSCPGGQSKWDGREQESWLHMWSTVLSLARSWGLLPSDSSIQSSTKEWLRPAASACLFLGQAWGSMQLPPSFMGSLCYSEVRVGLAMACSFSPSAWLLGNVSISKARRASAALTNAGTASHLLLCAYITACQGDTNVKRAISQSSDCETLCSRRARLEGVMGEGSTQGRLLQDWKAERKAQRGRLCCLPCTVLSLHAVFSRQGPAVHARTESGCRLMCLGGIGGKSSGFASQQGRGFRGNGALGAGTAASMMGIIVPLEMG